MDGWMHGWMCEEHKLVRGVPGILTLTINVGLFSLPTEWKQNPRTRKVDNFNNLNELSNWFLKSSN